MNWYGILQSILTYVLTTFAVAVATWAAKTSKRITILEEHDKAQQGNIDDTTHALDAVTRRLDEIVKSQAEMSTKLDLLLEGRIQIKGG